MAGIDISYGEQGCENVWEFFPVFVWDPERIFDLDGSSGGCGGGSRLKSVRQKNLGHSTKNGQFQP
jgi:hypothetical protein